jgi:hypothetical protein
LPASAFNRICPKMCASYNSKIIYVFGGIPDNKDANKKVEMLITDRMEWRPLKVDLPIEFKGNR